MKRQITGVGYDQLDLLRALADELKLPLIQIARTAELAEAEPTPTKLRQIETTANNALRLIDSYLLVTALSGQRQLDLSPVSVTALLYDVSQDARELAKLYNTEIDIRVKGSCGPVMAHAAGLRAALMSLVYTFLTGGARVKHQAVTLLAQATPAGIATGVVSSSQHISAHDLQMARALYGRAGQPAGGITQNSGVGLYMADHLFAAMESDIRAVKSGRQYGLVATLLPSQQLALL